MKEVTSNYRAGEIEDRVQTYWRESEVYSRVKDQVSSGPPFFFVDGPPYTTGNIHLGTAWNKIIKDSILRYQRMQGSNVIARAGYDMHGLPIEVRVEQNLGFSSKKDIEQFGIGPFIEECRRFAAHNKDLMSEQFQRLGVWLDFEDPYQTMSPEYIEAAWWTLQRADDTGMLERGSRVVNWCPRCATAIADAEVEYWDEEDPSIVVKFPIREMEGEFLVIWTTTPWTLPANVAVAVHPDMIYARARVEKGGLTETLWIAEDLLKPVLKRGRYQSCTILETRKGSDLAGMRYRSPLAAVVPAQSEFDHRVVTADFVTGENTGLVHIAPGHGWDDYLLGCREGLPIFCPVDVQGCFTDEGGAFSGMFVKAANPGVLEALGDHLITQETVSHRYGHCWRCKTPIIFRATEQWFLKISELRDAMLAEVEKVQWFPAWAGSARFHDWIKEARDWCISRQRYWGIPIPIWQCHSCGSQRVIGTIAELEEASGAPLPDPHRPYVDQVTIPCSCGSAMRRVDDIFDVWFDSAVASWATLRFPREREAFDQLWPAAFITEGQDQTRGWFYSQLGASTIAFGTSPYRSVLMHGFALDGEGRKMSKSLGNVVTPDEVISTQGVDVLRLYVLSSSAPWDDLRFNWEGVRTVSRAINIFWNVYRFPLPYMILDTFTPVSAGGTWQGDYITTHLSSLPDEDRWIVSRVNTLAAEMADALAECSLHRATRAALTFILEDLSRWYVQLVRARMWLEGESVPKTQAYETIYYVMRTAISLLAPFIPHITEEMYRNIRCDKDKGSVHMLRWPAPAQDMMDPDLERDMAIARSFDEALAYARQAGKRKLRWPVRRVTIAASSPKVAQAIRRLSAICQERANARDLEVVEGVWDRIRWRGEPVMKVLGPKFGRAAPVVRDLILAADSASMQEAFSRGDQFTLQKEGSSYEVDQSCVVFHEELPPDASSAEMDGGKVYIDLTLDDSLEAEAYAREVIRRVQEMRRTLDLAVEEFIRVRVAVGDPRIATLLSSSWVEGIQNEVRALSVQISGPGIVCDQAITPALVQDWDVEGISVTIQLTRSSGE